MSPPVLRLRFRRFFCPREQLGFNRYIWNEFKFCVFRQKSFENEDVITGGDTLLANVFANRYNFSSNVEYSINNEFYNPPMAKAKIFVNGEDIPNIQDSDHKYFKYVVPFSSRLSRPLPKHLHVCILDESD